MHPHRQIHLDFHTPAGVTVGDKFNATEFIDTLEAAKVNSIAVFAKCHHGYSYFDTKIGTRHPGLGFDLLGQMVTEAAKRRMPVLAYFSLNVDEVFAAAHPEYVAQFRDAKPVDTQILQDGAELYWRWLCPNRGSWLESFFFPHVEECLRLHPVDGIFIDMAGYLPGSCFCDDCQRLMNGLGIDPNDDTAHQQFNSATHDRFARELRRRMDAIRPGLRLEIGCYNAFGEATKAKGVVSDFYAETLAFQTGWLAFPLLGRYLSNTGVPVMGITGRFLKNWGDFGTVVSSAQMKYQVATHLMVGASSCIGDHLHCNGALEKAVYQTIGEAYTFLEARQAWCVGMQRLRDAAILIPDGVENAAMVAAKGSSVSLFDTLYGAVKFFTEEHIQWDVVDASMDWSDLRTLVVATAPANEAALGKLEVFAANGGSLFVDPNAILTTASFAARWHAFLGIKSAKQGEHPGTYYTASGRMAKGLPEMAHYVHAPGLELTPATGSKVLARMKTPPFVRSRVHFYGHFHGPDILDAGAALISSQDGRVLTSAQPLLAAYLQTGYHAHRTLLSNVFEKLLPKRLLRTDAPGQLEITLGKKDGKLVLQMLPFIADRRDRNSFESLNEPIPIGGFSITLADDPAIGKIHNPLTAREVKLSRTSRGVRFRPAAIREHTVLVAESN
ncbi:MAG: hypothetical protein WCQ57_03080 [Verrucomicrobiota bacterium]